MATASRCKDPLPERVSDVARRRRTIYEPDRRDIGHAKKELNDSLTSSAVFMVPFVEKNDAGEPLTEEEIFVAATEMQDMDIQSLRLIGGQLRAILRRDERRKETMRGRKMPVAVRDRLRWAEANLCRARESFEAVDVDAVEDLLAAHDQPGLEDPGEFVMFQYRRGMHQARTAWNSLFYALQPVSPIFEELDEKASKQFYSLKTGVPNEFTIQVDELAAERSHPVSLRDSERLVVYSAYPKTRSPLARQAAAKEPKRLRRQWHHIQKAAQGGVTLGSLTEAQSERIGEILSQEERAMVAGKRGRRGQPLSYLTTRAERVVDRLLLEQYYQEQYDVDMSDLNHGQYERAVEIVAEEGLIDPARLASRIGWRQFQSSYQTNLATSRAERAEHDAIWSLKF